MNGLEAIEAVVAALDLPARARVDTRVPKKLLAEQGAPTAADKRAIQDGVDELHWLAVLKPTTVAIPAFVDGAHDYSEIAVIGAAFRGQARVPRLSALIHRAIPYPVLLVSSAAGGIAVSVAPKRAAQNEGNKMVVVRVVAVGDINPQTPTPAETEFLASLALAIQPSRDLSSVYEGWLARIEALTAARLSGAYEATDDVAVIERRRVALEAHARIAREVLGLRTKANREKQLNRRVDLNMQIQRLEATLAFQKINL